MRQAISLLLSVALIVTMWLPMTSTAFGQSDSDMEATHLRTEYANNPLGIDVTEPRLSWQLQSSERGQYQTAYQIQVASSESQLREDNPDMWDTGKVDSDQSVNVVYEGAPLESGKRYYWRVQVWDKHGNRSEWSEPAWWEMGLLEESDWQAEWIGMNEESGDESEPLLRKTFEIDKPIQRARLYSTALGVYEPYMNGERVGEDIFAPGWTDYNKRIQYQTYDVTELLQSGENVIGAMLGDGWYAGHVAHLPPNVYGDQPYLFMQLEIDYEDGSSETIVTDESWQVTEGPIQSSDMIMGEIYDARHELTGWHSPGFDATNWDQVKVFDQDVEGELVAQAAPTVQVTEEIKPIEVTEPEPGTYVFDMGQNMVGSVRLKVSGDAGETVTLRHAEVLNPDGTLYTDNLRSAKATDQYTLKGDGVEIYEPHFTFHGFRYVEVTGFPGEPSLDAITGRVMHTAAPFTGEFETSNDMINQLQSNITWGQRGNFLSIPTDTPARDERMGWSGDINVFVGASTFNMDVSRFLGTKWLRDLRDAQSPNGAFPEVAPKVCCGEGTPGWGDAGVTVPWTLWQRYGDTRVIEENYDAMVRWIEYMENNSTDYLRPNVGLGDWLHVNDPTPNDVIATAYFAYSAQLLSEMADAIDRDEDAEKYAELFNNIKAAFNEAFVDEYGIVKGDSQAAYVLALYMDLIPESKRQLAADRLVELIEERDWHLSTGFLGTRDLLPVLSETGHLDVAYRLLLNDTFPSWGYQIKNGATTMWEHWDSIKPDGSFQDPSMNSFNHYAYGAVGDWMYKNIAGINHDPSNPGYKHTVIHPRPGGDLTYARGQYEAVYGTIVSEWEQEEDKFQLEVTIPANTTATVYVPAVSQWDVMESGQPAHTVEGIQFVTMENGHAVFEIGSGNYHFTAHAVGAAHMNTLVKFFEEAGEFANDRVVHSLTLHLTAVGRFEEQGAADKVVKHLNGFKQLLDHQQANAFISEHVYDVFTTYADWMIAQLVKEGVSVTLNVEDRKVHPGDHVQFEAVFENNSGDDIHDLNMSLTAPDGWEMTAETSPSTEVVKPGETFTVQFQAAIPKNQALTGALTIEGEAVYRKFGEAAKFPLSETMGIISPIRIQETQADPVEPGEETTLHVTVKNDAQQSFAGNITVEAPADWTVEPATQPYELDPGTEETLAFTVAAPEDAVRGAELRVSATYEDYTADETTTSVRLPGVSWEFDTDGDAQGWHPENQLTEFTVSDGVLTTQSTGGDPFMVQQEPLSLDASHGAVVQLTMKTSVSSGGQIFWGTEASPHFSEDKSARFEVKSGDFNVYQVSIPPQDSPIINLRIDPLTQEGDITIESIHLLR